LFGDGLGHRTRVWNIVATRYVTVRGCWRDQRGGFAAETRRALTRRANASENRGPGIKQAFDPRMIAVASVTVMGSFMSILDTTMVNVAVPTFVRSFRTSLSNVQWVTTGYILALAVVIPLTRWAADRFGTKRVWLVSVLLFTLGSLLCGLSWSLPTLIASRVIQGLGGGMILPTGQTILAREAGPHRLGRVMTVVGVPQFLAPLLGPVAGGLVLSTVSWRWIFFINLPIGVIALIRGRRILEAGELGTPERIDFLGMALLSPGFALLIYGIAEFGNVGAITSLVASTFLGGLSLLGLFAAHALRVERPLLDLRLWKNKSLAAATSVLFIFSSGLQAAVFSVQLYYQIGRGYSPLHAALLLAPGALGAMVALPFAGTLMDRRGARGVVPIGLTIIALSVLPFTQITPKSSLLVLSGFWLIRGMGLAATGTPTNAATYATLERSQIPGATTINNIAMRVGNSFGVAIGAAILQRKISDSFHGGSVAALTKLSPAHRAADATILSNDFRAVFWYTVVLVLLAIIPARKLPKRRDIGSGQIITSTPVQEGI
jgi:EmrB/QacA subfamily drug resistance transporter